MAVLWCHESTGPSDMHLAKGHDGPIMFYLARTDTPSLSWFKIWEQGLVDSVNTRWATNNLIDNKGVVEFSIPADIAPGNYLLRGEILALHEGYKVNGVQPYVGCVELTISGSGNANPAGVAIPGAYQNTDPGIFFNLYYPKPTSYIIPGPPVYTSGSAPGSSSSGTSGVATPAPSGGGSTMFVYDDKLENGFEDYSWVTTKYHCAVPAYSGGCSYGFVPSSWQAAYFYCAGCIDTKKFKAVEFWVNGGASGGQRVNFNIIKGNAKAESDFPLTTVTNSQLPPNTWVKGTVLLSGFAKGTYDGMWFQDASGNTQGLMYVDSIRLIAY